MTFENAQLNAGQLRQLFPDLRVGFGHERRSSVWAIQVQEPGTSEPITLPDALSVQSYLDARRGYRTEAGAPDFGPGRV